MPRRHLLALVALAAASTTPARDLSQVLPGDHHVAVLARPAALRADMPPALTGWLLDRPAQRLVRLGLPDLRRLTGSVGLGLDADLEARRLAEVTLVAEQLPPVGWLRKVAELAGVPVETRAYRGVTLHEAHTPKLDLAGADLVAGLGLLAGRPQGSPRRAEAVVDVLRGSRPSLAQTQGVAMAPDSYLLAALRLPADVLGEILPWLGEALETEGVTGHLQGVLELRRQGASQARLGLELVTESSWHARALAFALTKARDKAADEAGEGDLAELIRRIQIERDGARVLAYVVFRRSGEGQ